MKDPRIRFVEAMTRKKMVEWCDRAASDLSGMVERARPDIVYAAFAEKQGWLTVEVVTGAPCLMHKITPRGWAVAAKEARRWL